MSENEIEIVIGAKDEFSGTLNKFDKAMASSLASSKSQLSDLDSSWNDSLNGLKLLSKDGAGEVNKLSAAFKELSKEGQNAFAMINSYKSTSDYLSVKSDSPYVPDGGGTEVEATYNEYEQKIAALQEYNSRVLMVSAEHGANRLELEREYSDLEGQYVLKRRDLQITAAESSAGIVANTMQNLFVALGSKHKALFKVGQAFAIAETVINTYRAAMGAYAALAPIPIIGPVLATAAAATAVTAGMARVKEIKSARPGGGSISSGGTARASYSGGSQTANPVPGRLEDDGLSKSQTIVVNIHNPLSEQNWEKIAEDNLVPALNNLSDRNVALTIKTVEN